MGQKPSTQRSVIPHQLPLNNVNLNPIEDRTWPPSHSTRNSFSSNSSASNNSSASSVSENFSSRLQRLGPPSPKELLLKTGFTRPEVIDRLVSTLKNDIDKYSESSTTSNERTQIANYIAVLLYKCEQNEQSDHVDKINASIENKPFNLANAVKKQLDLETNKRYLD